jgi:hypothetical protein
MRLIVGALLLVLALASRADAACTTHTIFLPDGRTVICTTCCYGGGCTTTCF